MTNEVHFHLTKAQQEAICRIAEWRPIGELTNEVMFKLFSARPLTLDTDWIAEYIAFHDTRERTANDCASHL